VLAAGQHEQLVSLCSRSVVPLYKCTKEKGVSEPDFLDIMLIYMSASTQLYLRLSTLSHIMQTGLSANMQMDLIFTTISLARKSKPTPLAICLVVLIPALRSSFPRSFPFPVRLQALPCSLCVHGVWVSILCAAAAGCRYYGKINGARWGSDEKRGVEMAAAGNWKDNERSNPMTCSSFKNREPKI